MKRIEIGFLYRASALTAQEVKPANGKKFSLAELQRFVGGYIEIVPSSSLVAYCNEEGRLLRLPRNTLASDLFQQLLVGDVIQIKKVSI